MTQTAQDLRAARALIDRPEKWTQGSSAGRGGLHCIVTSIGHAVPQALSEGDVRRMEARDVVRKVIFGSSGTFASLMNWNDAPERTHDEVMKAMDAAIALAESTP